MSSVEIAVLDDYQGVALAMADWSVLDGRARVTVFRDHVADERALVERLAPFDVVCVMRERTPLPRAAIEGRQRSVGGDLAGRVLGGLGLGNIGARVAAVGTAFGMKVFAWSENLT